MCKQKIYLKFFDFRTFSQTWWMKHEQIRKKNKCLLVLVKKNRRLVEKYIPSFSVGSTFILFPEGILSGGAVLDTLFFMVNKMAALFADFKHTV